MAIHPKDAAFAASGDADSVRLLVADRGDSLRKVIDLLSRGDGGSVLVADAKGRLVGMIVDADVRRCLLLNINLDSKVSDLLGSHFRTAGRLPAAIPFSDDREGLLACMREHDLHYLPLINAGGVIEGAISIDELCPETRAMEAVVMAGGFGKRLAPLTDTTPKPMLPVGDRPLLAHIVESLTRAGIDSIRVTTHYMSNTIRSFLGDGSEFGARVECVEEREPRGTAGAISLIPRPDKPTLVINGDVLTRIDFRAMLRYHHRRQADMTVACLQHEMEIPYGVVDIEDARIMGIREKPKHTCFVNAGVYILNPNVHEWIPRDLRFDMTDLIYGLIRRKRVVAAFPVFEYWRDIGSLDDYQRAQTEILRWESQS